MKYCSLKRKVYFVEKGTCVCTYTNTFSFIRKIPHLYKPFKNTFIVGYLLMITFNIG